MSMPASGSIAIISAPQTCGSICAAVGCASGSLTTLSVAAGKTAPHGMREFYGYSSTSPINFTNITCCQSIRISYTLSLVGEVNAGTCVGATFCYYVTNGGGKVTSCAAVYCNGVVKYNCLGIGTGTFPTFTILSTDSVCVCTRAADLIGSSYAVARICLLSLTQCVGIYCLGQYTSDESTAGII